MGWTIIRTEADWNSYREQLARQWNMEGGLTNWGQGPQDYPCMVVSVRVGPLAAKTAYVYKEDLTPLLQAFGMSACGKLMRETFGPPPEMVGGAMPGQQQQAPVCMRATDKIPEAPTPKPSCLQEPVAALSQATVASYSAHLLALVWFVTETLCKQENYEAKYNEALSAVDAWQTEDRDKARAQMTAAQQAVMESLNPPK